jgi:hypothetical protein
MDGARRMLAAFADAVRRKARVAPERDEVGPPAEEDRARHGPAPADAFPRVRFETFAHRNSVLRACSSGERGPRVYRWPRPD